MPLSRKDRQVLPVCRRPSNLGRPNLLPRRASCPPPREGEAPAEPCDSPLWEGEAPAEPCNPPLCEGEAPAEPCNPPEA